MSDANGESGYRTDHFIMAWRLRPCRYAMISVPRHAAARRLLRLSAL